MAKTVSTENQAPRRRRSSVPLELPGSAREQERHLKYLLCALNDLKRHSSWTAAQAEKLYAALEATDIATLAINQRPTRDLLSSIVDLDDDLRSYMASLLGVDITHEDATATDDRGWTLSGYIDAAADDRREALMAHIHGWDKKEWYLNRKSAPQPSSATRSETGAIESRSAPTANDALAEAVRIAADARDLSVEIDWTENPADEREAALRKAMIDSVVEEKRRAWTPANMGAYTFNDVASWTLQALQTLAPDDAEEIGEDLFDAIEYWRQAAINEHECNKASEARALRDAALQKLRDEKPQSE